jgi:uncharacterized protein YndB with AHSA1/START domain
MSQITTAIEIDRPVEEVFAFITDLGNAHLWAVDLVEVRHNGPLARGSRGTDVRRIGRKEVELPWEVTRHDPPRVLDLIYGDPFPATAAFTFEPTSRGTRMSCDTTLRLRGIHRLMAPLAARQARKTDAEQFRRAKDMLERDPG